MKVTVTIWNTNPTTNQHFHVANGNDKISMFVHGWSYDSTHVIEFTPAKPNISACVGILEGKIRETQAAAQKACMLIREQISKLQALTYEELGKQEVSSFDL